MVINDDRDLTYRLSADEVAAAVNALAPANKQLDPTKIVSMARQNADGALLITLAINEEIIVP